MQFYNGNDQRERIERPLSEYIGEKIKLQTLIYSEDVNDFETLLEWVAANKSFNDQYNKLLVSYFKDRLSQERPTH